jgi:beta-galactosidase
MRWFRGANERLVRKSLHLLGYPLLAAGIIASGQYPAVGESHPSEPAQAIVPGSTGRTIIDFDHDWRFRKGDDPAAPMPHFDDSAWRRVELPHDWSIEGPFSPDYASATGYAPGGIGWYRKQFLVDPACRGKMLSAEFDAIYDHSEVWLNGHFIGGRPYGYSSFECLLTPLLHYGAQPNVLAVRVDHSRYADSRWYTGSGIYRHVRLQLTDPVHIAHWGICITTPQAEPTQAVIRVETTLENASGSTVAFSLESALLAPDGAVAATLTTSGELETTQAVNQRFVIPGPQRWDIESPRLYHVRSRVLLGGELVDETVTPFGIRSARFDAQHGFSLNGRSLKLKGVCLHHDAGGLGAAVPEQVLERRLRTLKELGVNAIRTSHNPPAPELLALCDQLGFLVDDEAFDEFTPGKNKWVAGRNLGLPSRFGYAEDFAVWSLRDIADLVRRDRNHPSVILWSIGNEIDYANDPFSDPVLGLDYNPAQPPAREMAALARPLIATVKSLDQTRPVTAALANVAMSDAAGFAELLDVTGYNYQEWRYVSDHEKFPRRILYGSENNHALGNWLAVRTNDFVAGQFLWTGIDYLGEAGPWPNRGSRAGLLDLCGFKKPLAWFRQSLWSDRPMVYLCVSAPGRRRARYRLFGQESWNWASNSTVVVHCFTTCPEVELSLNGKPLGTKRLADAVSGMLRWELAFQPGMLQARGLKGGVHSCEFALNTAGPPAGIELLPDRRDLAAAGGDVAQVEFHVVDAAGVRVPDADNGITFELSGPARLLAVENADLNSPESYQGHTHRVYHGRGLAIIESSAGAGQVTLRAAAAGLQPAFITFQTSQPRGSAEK